MNRISTRQRFLFDMLLLLLFVANVSLAQPPILAQPSKEDQSRIQHFTEIAVAEYEQIVAKIPFGSEWEITLTGEERSWANEPDWQFDERVVVNAKGNLQIPSVKLCICDIIMWIKIILTNISDPKEQEEAVRRLVPSYMVPREQEESEFSFLGFVLPPDWLEKKIRFQGSAEWTAGRYFSKTGDGKHDVSIEYDPCPPWVKRIACNEYIIIDVNGFCFEELTHARRDSEVVGGDPPKRKGIKKEIGSNWTRRIEDDCPGGSYYQESVPVLVHDKSLKMFSFREGTVRVIEHIDSESGSLKNSYHIDMNLRQVRPRDPIESLLTPVNISRITPSWSPNSTLSTGEIKDKRAQLTGKVIDPDAIQLGWTHPDIPPEKPHVEIEWHAEKWEEDPSLICIYVTKVDVAQKLTISMFIANKYRPGTCPYEAILSHEMKHADGYTSATDTYLSEVKKALLKSTGIPWPSRPLIIPTSAVSQEQDRVTKVVHDTVWPLFLRLLEIFREQEVALDTPAEYARVRASCPDSDWK